MKPYICFPNGKFKVLTMSYDDGKLEDRRLIEIFNRYHIKGVKKDMGRNRKTYKDEFKLKCIKELLDGKAFSEVCSSNNVSHSTLSDYTFL